LKIRLSLDLDEAMMGAVVENAIGLWLSMTGECSSATTRRFTSSFLSIEYLIGRKWHYVNLDKKI